MSDELINVPSLLWSDYCQMFIDIENSVWHRIVLSNRTKSNSGALGSFRLIGVRDIDSEKFIFFQIDAR